jgi:hypothetical protein
MNTFEDRTENHEVKRAATTFIVTNFYSAEDILGEIISLPIVVFPLIRRLNRPELRKTCSGDLHWDKPTLKSQAKWGCGEDLAGIWM